MPKGKKKLTGDGRARGSRRKEHIQSLDVLINDVSEDYLM